MNDDQWDEDFLLQLNESEEGIEEEGEEDEEQEQLNEPTIKKRKEAIVPLKKYRSFLKVEGNMKPQLVLEMQLIL